MVDGILTAIGVMAAVGFLVELFLYGTFAAPQTQPNGTISKRGDRVVARMIAVGQRWADLGTTPTARYYRWIRNALIVAVVIIIALTAWAMISLLSSPSDASSCTGSFGQCLGQAVGEVIAFAIALVLGIVVIGGAILFAIVLFLVQWLVFGVRGREPVGARLLDYMAHNVHGILGATGALSAFATIYGLLR